jgi:hypothetical protein
MFEEDLDKFYRYDARYFKNGGTSACKQAYIDNSHWGNKFEKNVALRSIKDY